MTPQKFKCVYMEFSQAAQTYHANWC